MAVRIVEACTALRSAGTHAVSDNLLGIPETRLAVDPAAEKLEAGVDPVQVAADLPRELARVGGPRRGRARRR